MEASITKRLQKLKQWQAEQREKLLKQQQIQREILSHEQDRIYQALGFPTYDFNNISENAEDQHVIHEMDAEETTFDASTIECNTKNSDRALEMAEEKISTDANTSYKDCKEEETEDSNHIAVIADKNRNSTRDYSPGVLSQEGELNTDLLIEGIKPLPLDNIASNKCVTIDEIPVPSPRKDFQTLLEERLRKEPEVAPTARTDSKIKIKKPFLKKGQGLSRFKMPLNSRPPLSTMRRHSGASLSLGMQHTDRSDKGKKSAVDKAVLLSESSNNISPASETRQLSLKAVPLPRKIIHNASTPITSVKQTTYYNANNSDFDSKAERELEEVRIFELLEEKAENSSFCSTSSTVLAFLQQSTPFKMKELRKFNCAESEGGVANTKRPNDKRTSDNTAEREPMLERYNMHGGNSKPSVSQRSRTRSVTIGSYWDTVTTGDTEEKETRKRGSAMVDRMSQSCEIRTDHLENRATSYAGHIFTASRSDSEEGEDISAGDRRNATTRDGDTSHRVRFSKHNEYRTIDLIDVSILSDKSSSNDYLEPGNWKDCSAINAESESSDVEEEEPRLNYKERVSSLKASDDRLSLQHGTTKDSYYHAMKTPENVSEEEEEEEAEEEEEEEEVLNCKEDLLGEDIRGGNKRTSIVEEIVQNTSDEEQSVLSLSSSSSSSSGTRRELCTHEKKERVLGNEPEKITDKIAKVCSNVETVEHCPLYEEDRTDRTKAFGTPELLKNRLLELEKEIDIFRKESSALLLQRRKLQEDQTTLRKEYAEKERHFEENKRRVQNQLEEERRRLTRERAAMENRIRDAQEKTRQNKVERQKAQDLQEQLEKLRDELHIKESRWSAAESRYKSELRALRVETTKLKQEIASLRNVKRTNARNAKKSNGQVITRAISRINKCVAAIPSKETPVEHILTKKTSRDLSSASSDTSVHDDDHDHDDNDENKDKSMEMIMKATERNDGFEQMRDPSVSANKKDSPCEQFGSRRGEKFAERNAAKKKKKKRHSRENLSKDDNDDDDDDDDDDDVTASGRRSTGENENSSHVARNTNDSRRQSTAGRMENSSAKSDDDIEHMTGRGANNDAAKHPVNDHDNNRDKNDAKVQKEAREVSSSLERTSVNSTQRCRPSFHRTSGNGSTSATKGAVKQIQRPDGRVEYWYPNGNVKKIFPEQGATKMIYYNGDVRETDRDGKVKYFYAATRTWHTTTPDGLEILEFPDGQIERRMSDGTIEVSFPDGVVRIAQTNEDGTKTWTLPNGTVVQTFTNGDRILTLSNGQREIHTKAHKRREYPDGTVKLIYPDGTQETRYSNGRKRLKDKDGNLLMDLYDLYDLYDNIKYSTT